MRLPSQGFATRRMQSLDDFLQEGLAHVSHQTRPARSASATACARPDPSLRRVRLPRLVPCPECDQPISARAITCPKCGRPLQVRLVLAVAFALVLWGVYAARAIELLHRTLR